MRCLNEKMAAEAAWRGEKGRSDPEPVVLLVSVTGLILGAVCEEIFGAPGLSVDGLKNSGATLVRALDEVYEGLQTNCDIGKKLWMCSTLAKWLRMPAQCGIAAEVGRNERQQNRASHRCEGVPILASVVYRQLVHGDLARIDRRCLSDTIRSC